MKQPKPLQSFVVSRSAGQLPAPSHAPALVICPRSVWHPATRHALPAGANAHVPCPSHVPPHAMNEPLHSLWASLPAAAFTHLPSWPVALQTWQVLLPPKQALSQQTLSTQWFDPQSESFVQVAPFGLRPL